jgi:putative sigma-54 modulation protein
MNITFTFNGFEPSDHLRAYARRRMEKLGRYFSGEAELDIQVVLQVDKFRHRADVQCKGEGLRINAEEVSDDMYTSIDLVTDKLDAQFRKFVDRNRETRRQRGKPQIDVFDYQVLEEEGVRHIVGRDHFLPKPMEAEEAALQLDARDLEFLVFLHAATDRINVIYKRRTGGYGLIDPHI